MIKNIKESEISKKLQNPNVSVGHFSVANVRCIKDYLKASWRENPDHFILYVGTNDLDSDRSPDLVAKSIVDDASSLKADKQDVTISSIITRNDRFIAKENDVNKYFTELCFARNFLLIDHSKTLKSQHLNESKLHLNRGGTPILQNTFTIVLSSIFRWQKEENRVASTPLLNEEYIPEAKNPVDKINVNAELRSVRVKNLNKLIIGHLNINSLRNKFELLMHQIKDNIDTLKKQTPNMSILQF